MDKIFDIKWQKNLANHILAYNTFIFEGNVNDLQPTLVDDKFEYLPLEKSIAEILKEQYCVVFYDHKKKGRRVIGENQQQGQQNQQNQNAEQPAQEAEPDAAFNSFSFLEKTVIASNGERIPNPNIKLFEKFYTNEFVDAIRDKQDASLYTETVVDMRRILDSMDDYGKKVEAYPDPDNPNKMRYRPINAEDKQYEETKPFLFIFPELSRIMVNPGSPSARENPILVTLFSATLLDKTPCRLMIIVDKMNDLPTWFEAESSNPSLSKVYIPNPDDKLRKDFFNHELADPNSPIMTNITLDGDKPNEKGINKFSAYTEKFSLRKLVQLKQYIEYSPNDSDRDLNRIDKTVFAFLNGINDNPWLKPDTFRKIKDLKEELQKAISGQDHVIDQVQSSLRAAVTGVNSSKSNDRRPKAVFFLAGPTGTGKTEMCRQLATLIFGKEDSMIRFDMSEFKEAHNQARLFGAPPGYVGYGQGGELTKAIKENPFSLLLFDEIEKADPSIWDKFLQILGDGRVTDGKGETVYFSECVIVFTSNLGITSIVRQNDPKEKEVFAKARKALDEEVAKYDSLPSDAEKERSRDVMRDKLIELVNYDGISIKYANEEYFKIMSKDSDVHASRWEHFCMFTSEVVSKRISAYFEGISRREVLGRIGESNIIVYRFINKNIAEMIMNNTIKKFVNYLANDNIIPLELSIPEGGSARQEMVRIVQQPNVLDLGGRGINMTTEKIISNATSEFLFEIMANETEDSANHTYHGELVFEDNKFKIIQK